MSAFEKINLEEDDTALPELSNQELIYDIVRQSDSDEKIRIAHERLKLATDAGQMGIWDWDIATNRLVWDDRMYELYGVNRRDFAGAYEAWLSGIHPDDMAQCNLESEAARRGEKKYDTEFRIIRPDGCVRYIKALGTVFRDAKGTPTRMLGLNYDITERKQAEERLVAEKVRTAAILSGIADTFYSIDKDWRFTFVNPAAEKAPFGRPAKELLGKVLWELYPGLLGTSIEQHYLRAARDHTLEHYEAKSPLNGRWYEVFMQGRHEGVDVYMRDITDRMLTDEALRESNEYLRTLLASSPLAIIVLDPNGHVLLWNHAAERMFGWTEKEVMGRFLPFVSNEKMAEHVALRESVLSGESFAGIEAIRQRKDGTPIEIAISTAPLRDASGKITGIMSVNMDITERKRTESVLQKVQKMDLLGVLAGGIAHDFNNLLSGIFGFIDLTVDKVKDEEAVSHLLEALSTIDRARALTRQLLTFSKGGAPVKKTDYLGPLIREAVGFALSGSKISCVFDIQDDLWVCEFDKEQILQGIDNIVINARQAMPGSGTISIRAENVVVDARIHATLKAGRYVKVSVCDRGMGIPAEHLPRIFDPFFTTKQTGHGLGLATCHSIIHRHGGCIDVESTVGFGTTFYIYLPASTDVVEVAAVGIKAPSKGPGRGTILLMDDESVVRDTIAKMLAKLGYSVICTETGSSALKAFEAECEAHRCLSGIILDLTVPGDKGGREVVGEIRKVDKNVPVFVVSGYAADPVMVSPESYGFTGGISKPFRTSELAELLGRYLDLKS